MLVRRSTTALIVLGMLVALLPAAAVAQEAVTRPTEAATCVLDAAADTFDMESLTTSNEPKADVLEFCFEVVGGELHLFGRTSQPEDPGQNWYHSHDRHFDFIFNLAGTDSSTIESFVSYYSPGQGAITSDSNGQGTTAGRLCSGTGTYDGTWYHAGAYTPQCLGAERFDQLSVLGIMTYDADTTADNGSARYQDQAPNSGFVALGAAQPPPNATGSISGVVRTSAGAAAVGSYVYACANNHCGYDHTDETGSYTIGGLPAGTYTAVAFAPEGSNDRSAQSASLTLADGEARSGVDVQLRPPPAPPPADTTVSTEQTAGGVPSVRYDEAFTITTTGCAGGTASYVITKSSGEQVTGTMSETATAGTYQASVQPLGDPGSAAVRLTVTCPDPTDNETVDFDIYIDPAGNVVDQNGNPIVGATVTLLRSDSPDGPFTVVPDGSAIMSPENRTNPDTTDAAGGFQWLTISGYYIVTAEAQGCRNPNDASQTTNSTGVLPVPPEQVGLIIVLDCSTGGGGGGGGGAPGNNAPVAANDTAFADAGLPLLIDVLANDSDPDNEAVTLDAITTAPAHGTATIVDGKIRYVANKGYTGSDRLTYRITDARGQTATGELSLEVEAPGDLSQGCPDGVVDRRQFPDVSTTNAHAFAVDCAASRGIASGYADGTYRPGRSVRRDHMASFIINLLETAGVTIPRPSEKGFSDTCGVHDSNVEALAALGVVSGRTDGSYGCDEPVSRSQMATFLVGAFEVASGTKMAAPSGDHFPDADGTHGAAVNKSFEAGFTTGRADGSYGGGRDVRRDQMASFLARVLDALAEMQPISAS